MRRMRSLILALFLLLPVGLASAGGGEISIHREGERAIGARLPTDDQGWRPVTLPDRWNSTGSPDFDHWYRFEVPGGEGPLGVLLLDVAMNAAVYWNGVLLGDGGRFDPPIAQNFHRPLYFRVPDSMVREDGNHVLVRVAAPAHFRGWLGPVRIGPEALVRPGYESDLAWRHRLPQMTSLLGAGLVVLLLVFYFASRDSTYAWFALAVALASIANLNLHVQDLPVPTMVWARGIQLAICLQPIVFAIFVHRFLGIERPRTERAFAIVALVLVVLAFVVPDRLLLRFFTPLLFPAVALCFYLIVLLSTRIRALSRVEMVHVVLACAVVAFLALHDALGLSGLLPGEPRFWSPFVLPLVMSIFGSVLTIRFGRMLRRAERHNEELERRVREKHEELEDQYQRLRAFERENLLTGERQRIMREMHDGLGGRIVETLAMVEEGDARSDEIAESLRTSLEEMRLMIDSLDPMIADLPTLLATVRERFERGLRRTGIDLVWEVDELPRLSWLGPKGFLHLLRIFQEAFTNVSRHARARRVTLRARVRSDGDSIEISVEDDGRGLGTRRGSGRGLGNMRERAVAMGGTVEITSRGSGTRVRLVLPVAPASSDLL